MMLKMIGLKLIVNCLNFRIEDEYVIRFTQARPGEDGEGGIGTPGDDGEHAEIEIEDTDTGIRVRGKSGVNLPLDLGRMSATA